MTRQSRDEAVGYYPGTPAETRYVYRRPTREADGWRTATHIRPRDALKLGQLYLDGGVWNGKRIVSRSWVAVSTTRHPMNARGTDGYDWHTNDIKWNDRVFKEYDASGNGGQLIMVVPELDLAVMFTAANYLNYGVWRHFRDEFLPQYIIAAIRDR